MPSQRLEEGARLGGRYEILEVIGRGGMGTVYRALDSRLDTVVAVKEMAERYHTPDEREAAARQFEREAKLLGQLQHANLPRVTDYFVDGDHCYLIMEFVEGQPLDTRLRNTGGLGLPLQDVIHWAVQLADVLVYLHSQDPPVVFRDLKPANIMLLPDNAIKLIDFGIARRFQVGATKDTLLYGSPGYSPPEQYGRSQTDPRSDLYALGATLHHLVTGRDPAPTPFKFAPVRSLNPGLPPPLETLISRCVEMDINKRCQTALEARDELLKIRRIVSPPRPSTGETATDKPQTGPRVVSARIAAFDRGKGWKQLVPVAGALAVLVVVVLAAMYVRRPTVHATAPPSGAPEPAPDTLTSGGSGALSNAPGRLKVTTTPQGVTVYLDSKEAGVTPLDIPEVAPGKHTLRLAPAADSGFAELTRDVQVTAGTPLEVDLHLASAGSGAAAAPAAEVQNLGVQRSSMRDSEGVTRQGIRVTASVRVTGAAGKPGMLGAFFYGADRVTPLRPRIEGTAYQNAEGQLSVAQSFEVSGDPADLPGAALFIPEAVFPVSYDQATWRLIVFVDGKPVFQTPIGPLAH